MPRPPRAKQPLKDAALQLIVEQGVHGTGIREIASRAGCSEAALYRHWENKDAMVQSLFREHLQEVNRLLGQALRSDGSLADQVLAAARATYRLYDEQPLVFRFVLLVQHEVSPFIGDDIEMPQDVITAWLRDHIAAGRATGDAVLNSAALIGVFLWTAQYVLYGRLPGPLSRYAEQVATVALAIITR
jgi:AcrR family transcriptional regulator